MCWVFVIIVVVLGITIEGLGFGFKRVFFRFILVYINMGEGWGVYIFV